MTAKQSAFCSTAETIIKNLKKRNIEGFFFEDCRSCVSAIRSMLPNGCSVSWGGSESLKESGIMELLKNGNYEQIDRSAAASPEEARQLYAKSVLSDYYFMSSNAITVDGKLVNIDGNSNRVGCLVHGPSHVFLIIGSNKVTADVDSAIKRIQTVTAPANAKRLSRKTPCNDTGFCSDCLSPDCMCNQIVVTRRSGHEGRIKVFLIAEELGY